MQRVIWKYELAPGTVEHEVPQGNIKVVSVGLDPSGVPSVWLMVEVRDEEDTAFLSFLTVPTGAEFDDKDHCPIGSFSPSPGLMFHVLVDVVKGDAWVTL